MDDLGLATAIRSFNRFYTETIGALDERHEGLNVNLAQSRILYTVRRLGEPEVSEVARELGLDLSYTSRILSSLHAAKLLGRNVSSTDGRRRTVRLTPTGNRVISEVERRSNLRVLGLVDQLDEAAISELLEAMKTVRHLLSKGLPACATRSVSDLIA